MSAEKPFEPTQSRLERARREGDVARSQEIGNVAGFAGALLAVSAVIAPLGAAMHAVLFAAARRSIDGAALAAAAVLMLVPLAAAASGAFVAGIAQAGGLRLTPLQCKPQRLSPSENLKRMLSKEAGVTALRASVAFICAALALIPACTAIFAAALHAAGPAQLALTAWSGALQVAAAACAVGAVFAGMDYGLQAARRRNRLRMSSEELKRDQKEHDGDPLARSRRRAIHRRIARGSLRKVRDAAFVVTNPTHLAIALEYRPPRVCVPRVLVRAADDAAARVRTIACEHGIPLVHNVALARALYAGTQPGDFIPRDSYVAVAEIVIALQRVASREDAGR